MDSSLTPTIANVFMGNLENETIFQPLGQYIFNFLKIH